MPMPAATLAERYAAVKAQVRHGVTLVAVSKKRTAEEVRALYDLGHRDFGENYAQELREKQAHLPPDIRWHFIGHLQRSNARHIVPIAHLIHGIDSEALLDEVEKRAAANGQPCAVLAQVHIAREETKHGLSADEARALGLHWLQGAWPNVLLQGLMGMATNTTDMRAVRAEFDGLAELHTEIRSLLGKQGAGFNTLSMGMSGDLAEALAAGSNLVRVGTAIFGERG